MCLCVQRRNSKLEQLSGLTCRKCSCNEELKSGSQSHRSCEIWSVSLVYERPQSSYHWDAISVLGHSYSTYSQVSSQSTCTSSLALAHFGVVQEQLWGLFSATQTLFFAEPKSGSQVPQVSKLVFVVVFVCFSVQNTEALITLVHSAPKRLYRLQLT